MIDRQHSELCLRKTSAPNRKVRGGFTLVEVLVVVSVMAVLLAILLPSLAAARMQGKVVRVRAELYQITVGIEAYHKEHDGYPPASTTCASGGAWADHYNHLPTVLSSYISGLKKGAFDTQDPEKSYKFAEDPFNPGHTYKYTKPGRGYSMGAHGPNQDYTIVDLWVPKRFPHDRPDSNPAEDVYWDNVYFKPCPVEYAVWSVGPAGPKSWLQSAKSRYPIPRRTWYRMSSGLRSEGVITIIKARKNGFIQSEP